MIRNAEISKCGRYRWSLSRSWHDDPRNWVGFIMLNPSTADAAVDDPTIRRCIAFARSWGFSGLAVRNLFALRATNPGRLHSARDPIGSANDAAIFDLIGFCPLIVAAWGVHGGLLGRGRQVAEMLAGRGQELKCLGLTKGGHPRHPLYVAADTNVVRFMVPCASMATAR
jgi:hypothetical protein